MILHINSPHRLAVRAEYGISRDNLVTTVIVQIIHPRIVPYITLECPHNLVIAVKRPYLMITILKNNILRIARTVKIRYNNAVMRILVRKLMLFLQFASSAVEYAKLTLHYAYELVISVVVYVVYLRRNIRTASLYLGIRLAYLPELLSLKIIRGSALNHMRNKTIVDTAVRLNHDVFHSSVSVHISEPHTASLSCICVVQFSYLVNVH